MKKLLGKVLGISVLDVLAFPVFWLARILGWVLSAAQWLTVSRLSAIALGMAVGFGIFTADKWLLTEGRIIAREIVVMTVADKMAGAKIPVKVCDAAYAQGRSDCELIYSRSELIYPGGQWGLVTNSPYLTEVLTNMTAFFEQEDIVTNPWVPQFLVFQPYPNEVSFHNLGRTDCRAVVALNERVLTFGPWNDKAELLVTVTHELIHNQQGNFCNYPVPIDPYGASPLEIDQWLIDRSVWVESHTTAATLEVLAAACQMGDEVGCKAFWNSMNDSARGALYTELKRNHVAFLYTPIVDVLTRNDQERRAAHKSIRDWAERWDEREDLIEKYQYLPYDKYILPGIRFGIPLNTGNLRVYLSPEGFRAWPFVLGMRFDDTNATLGWLGAFIRVASVGLPQ